MLFFHRLNQSNVMAFDIDLVLFFVCAIPGLIVELRKQLLNVSAVKTKPQFQSKDHGTFPFIWLMVICSMGLSIHYIRVGYGWKMLTDILARYVVLFPLSMCLIMLGRRLREQAIQQLGEWFTMTICVNERQELIKSGLYATVRHPSYTGVLLIFLGLGLVINNWLGLLGMVVPQLLVILYRIHIEEQELRTHFGPAYDEYARQVPARLIPHVY